MLNRILQPNAPIDEDRISAFVVRYKIKLPLSYRIFLLKNNGGQPVPAAFPIGEFTNNPDGVIQAFFGLDASLSTENMDAIMTELADRIPKGILPIACTEGDDFVCFDLRGGDQAVVFWDRKQFWGNNMWSESDLYPVADSFDLFLESLHEL